MVLPFTSWKKQNNKRKYGKFYNTFTILYTYNCRLLKLTNETNDYGVAIYEIGSNCLQKPLYVKIWTRQSFYHSEKYLWMIKRLNNEGRSELIGIIYWRTSSFVLSVSTKKYSRQTVKSLKLQTAFQSVIANEFLSNLQLKHVNGKYQCTTLFINNKLERTVDSLKDSIFSNFELRIIAHTNLITFLSPYISYSCNCLVITYYPYSTLSPIRH